jgi:hypothetical protein
MLLRRIAAVDARGGENGPLASLKKGPPMSFVTEAQIQFGRRIGLDLAGKTDQVTGGLNSFEPFGEPQPRYRSRAEFFSGN